MADRTFSSNDVLRIFELHLDPTEQEVVRMFFTEPSDINLQILKRLLQLVLDFRTVFTGPLIGLAISVLPQVVSNAYNALVDEFFGFTRSLDREIGRVDA